MENDIEFNPFKFISKPKSYLIAPAGYGKTHTIAECLNYTEGKQLILTHTHAGVASIKEKIKKNNIPSNKYKVETISSYAQKYVFAFYRGDLPKQENSNEYFSFIIDKATELLKIKLIANVVRVSYTGLFVDEYQDCTKRQHKLILALSDILPTHILGDPLQGIFGFNDDPLVNIEDKEEMGEFIFNKYELSIPWRWKNYNDKLGIALKDIRTKLIKNEAIILSDYSNSINTIISNEVDIYDNEKEYRKTLWKLANYKSVLLIHPEEDKFYARIDIAKRFNNCFTVAEAIDEKSYYQISKKLDKIKINNLNTLFNKILPKMFYSTDLNNWFNDKGIINKRKEEDKIVIRPVKDLLDLLKKDFNYFTISRILREVKKISSITCFRKELLNTLCEALISAEKNKISIYESMKNIRNNLRWKGRKIEGKYIGTTLLTKGLEFDIVAILDAHKIKSKKSFYVAITRACRKLIIFTESMELNPYDN
jgi:superfamily I DNA/RNA helicase